MRFSTLALDSVGGDLVLPFERERFFSVLILLLLLLFFLASSSELAETKTLRSISDVLAKYLEK
jgi:hypothetical protein